MLLTKTYRIWWNDSNVLLSDPEINYNPGSSTAANETNANIFGFYESNIYDDIVAKIILLGLIRTEEI